MKPNDTGGLNDPGPVRGAREDRTVADGGVQWSDLSGFQRDVLVSISRMRDRDGPTIGVDIMELLDSEYVEEVSSGRLYPNLNDLVHLGLVEKGEVDRRTNSYALSDEAEALLIQRAERMAETVGLQPQVVTDGGSGGDPNVE